MCNLKQLKFLHDWGKWTRPINEVYNERHQFRECNECGKVQQRRVWNNSFVNDTKINEELDDVFGEK